MRSKIFTLVLLCGLASSQTAHSQVSDADRSAARDLFAEGFQLQQSGKYAEALDKFQRSQSVFSAPTTQLHVAECQAALGKLVESSETYRALVRSPLPPNASRVFQAAQSQGAAELQQVEPRVPTLKVDVTPANVSNLSVTIDGQPINSALIGVARPVNPGTHKVVATAPGYAPAEQTVDTKERTSKAITLALHAGGGGFAAASAGTSTQGSNTAAPPPYKPSSETDTSASPKAAEDATAAKPEHHSQTSLLLGLGVGAIVPFGKTGDVGELENSMSAIAGPGLAVPVQVGLRFARHVLIDLTLEYDKYNGGSAKGVLAPKTSSDGALVGLTAGYIFNPERVSFYGELGVGYRSFSINDQPNSALTPDDKHTGTFDGADFLLAAGVFIPVGPLRLLPKGGVSVGKFSKFSCSSGECPSASGSIDSTGTHAFIFAGMSAFFDINLDKK